MSYTAPVPDILLAMKTAGRLEAGLYRDLQVDDVTAILQEASRFASEKLVPLNRIGDTQGSRMVDGLVLTPDGWKDAYRDWCDAGWCSLTGPIAFGGQALPMVMAAACTEMWNAASLAFAVNLLLTASAIEAIGSHASHDLKAEYLPKLIAGRWTGTMNLTEPQAGSDLAGLRCKATRGPGQTYRITGSKIYITYGEHDWTDNIVHLVLARLPHAPQGTRGISLFLVPKFLPDGTKNDIRCHSLEHKLGFKGSPTCTMIYGDKGGAVGWLIGEENRGLNCMFTMMNNARLLVGVQGVGLAERATQAAFAYARERRQGRAPGTETGQSRIIEHPDVKRMLLEMQSKTMAARLLCMATASAIDEAVLPADADQKEAAHARASLLTPLAKSFSTDIAVEVASLAVQVHGGMGYIEETGVAQLLRDARILPIYEGTNGIQAIDLVTRKLQLQGGETLRLEMESVLRIAAEWEESQAPSFLPSGLRDTVQAIRHAVQFITSAEEKAALAAAVPFQRALAAMVAAGLFLKAALHTQRSGTNLQVYDCCLFFVSTELALAKASCEALPLLAGACTLSRLE